MGRSCIFYYEISLDFRNHISVGTWDRETLMCILFIKEKMRDQYVLLIDKLYYLYIVYQPKKKHSTKSFFIGLLKKKNCWNLYWDKNFEFKRTKLYFKGKRNSSTKHNLSKNGPTFIIEDFFFLSTNTLLL